MALIQVNPLSLARARLCEAIGPVAVPSHDTGDKNASDGFGGLTELPDFSFIGARTTTRYRLDSLLHRGKTRLLDRLGMAARIKFKST